MSQEERETWSPGLLWAHSEHLMEGVRNPKPLQPCEQCGQPGERYNLVSRDAPTSARIGIFCQDHFLEALRRLQGPKEPVQYPAEVLDDLERSFKSRLDAAEGAIRFLEDRNEWDVSGSRETHSFYRGYARLCRDILGEVEVIRAERVTGLRQFLRKDRPEEAGLPKEEKDDRPQEEQGAEERDSTAASPQARWAADAWACGPISDPPPAAARPACPLCHQPVEKLGTYWRIHGHDPRAGFVGGEALPLPDGPCRICGQDLPPAAATADKPPAPGSDMHDPWLHPPGPVRELSFGAQLDGGPLDKAAVAAANTRLPGLQPYAGCAGWRPLTDPEPYTFRPFSGKGLSAAAQRAYRLEFEAAMSRVNRPPVQEQLAPTPVWGAEPDA